MVDDFLMLDRMAVNSVASCFKCAKGTGLYNNTISTNNTPSSAKL